MVRIYKNSVSVVVLLLVAFVSVSCNKNTSAGSSPDTKEDQIKHGQYIVRITGCNDCHTTGYPEADGNIPVEEWLTGSPIGWKGPWGTTYAINLRLLVQTMTAEQWLHNARNVKSRPPMPWYVLHYLSDSDLVAMYEFIKSLGPAGELMPAYVPPGEEPNGSYVEFPSTM